MDQIPPVWADCHMAYFARRKEMDEIPAHYDTFVPQIDSFRSSRLALISCQEKNQEVPNQYLTQIGTAFKTLMRALNWPNWPIYEQSKPGSEEHKKFQQHKEQRRKNVSRFFQEGGVQELLQWTPLFKEKSHPNYTFVLIIAQKFVLTVLQAAEYEQWEQKFLCECGVVCLDYFSVLN